MVDEEPGRRKSRRVQLRIEKDVYARAQAHATAREISLSEAVNDLIRRAMQDAEVVRIVELGKSGLEESDRR